MSLLDRADGTMLVVILVACAVGLVLLALPTLFPGLRGRGARLTRRGDPYPTDPVDVAGRLRPYDATPPPDLEPEADPKPEPVPVKATTKTATKRAPAKRTAAKRAPAKKAPAKRATAKTRTTD